MISALNVAGKISSAGKLLERLNALGNLVGAFGEPQRYWTAQAIEDTLVVVGNPWQPVITGFFPQSGYRGSVVRIDGQNFSALTNQNIVTFGQLSTDPENPSLPARAEVLSASLTSLLVRVPDEADTGSITVAVPGKGSVTTAELGPPFTQFVVLADPVITSIVPDPPLAGQPMDIRGSNFASITDRQELVFSAGNITLQVTGARDVLTVRCPNSTAPNSVKVRIRDRESNDFPFTPGLPPVSSQGANIVVTTNLDNTAADGDISLREAMLLAAGGITALGRPLTSPPNPRDPGLTYETDYVTFPPGSPRPGAATRDTIRFLRFGETNFVDSPLPLLENNDDYGLYGIVDGRGLAADGFGIVGKSHVSLQVNKIRNFGGHGIFLSGPSRYNLITGTVVERCGGFGVLFENGATANELTFWSVSSNTAGGIRIIGSETVYNLVRGSGFYTDTGRIFDNSGPGLWITSPSNVVRGVSVGGNQGDGILLEDSSCHDVWISDTRSGYDHWLGQARPNQGNGLRIRHGAQRIIVGSTDGDETSALISESFGLNCFAGNRDNGIRIEGPRTENIFINLTVVGAGLTLASRSVAFPNGTNGIAVVDNAANVVIGSEAHSGVVIANHTNGAGIYFAQTASNVVLGCKIGRDDIVENRLGNRYGIHLAGGAYANVIGVPGIRQVNGVGDGTRVYDSRNFFFGNVEAAILLESGGDPARTIAVGEVASGGNVIQNNVLGSSSVAGLENRAGILLRQGAIVNRIGGAFPAEANQFIGNQQAGILIDGAVITRPGLANRIIGNQFLRQGSRVSTPGDPLSGLPAGVGVAIVNGAAGHFIGGLNFNEGNTFSDNHVAVQLELCQSNHVIGNELNRNKAGGIVLLNSSGNVIGPFNEIYRNGSIPIPVGGVVLKLSTNNTVIGNWIGLQDGSLFAFGDGNNPYGVGLLDAPANLIGDLGGKNIIVGSGTHGVMVSGSGSTGNQIANNHVGFSPVPGVFASANAQAGVLLINGAHDNLVGGERPGPAGNGILIAPAPNYIQRNLQDGVRVDGIGSTGNRILYNSIADHAAGLGIQNLNGGNIEIPPPTLTSANGFDLVGSVNAAVPDGSLVQIFSDTADEGRTFLGETVVNGGQFQFAIPLFAGGQINATVTHAIQGHTSEFAPLIINTNNAVGLELQRVTQPPATLALPVPGPVAVALAFSLRALGGPVLVASIAFKSTGTANESAPGTSVYLYRDEDQDGLLTQTDFRLSGPKTFTTNNASVTFTPLGRVINPGADQHWLLVLVPGTNSMPPDTFTFEITSQTSVSSRSLITGETITEIGGFPLLSDTLNVTAGQSAPSSLSIHRGPAGELTLDWTGSGILESAPAVNGLWSPIPDASFPFLVAPGEPQQFFRFRP